jgi:hypothetical protein
MDEAFWLDNLLAACAALSAIVLGYGAWLSLSGALEKAREWLARRMHAQHNRPIAEKKS